MNRVLKQKVIKVAKEVRSWAEEIAEKNPFNYESDLCGLCAIASAKLHKQLKKLKINSEIHLAEGHVFVVVENHIVDVTATQFGHRSKVVIKRNKNINAYYWKAVGVFKSAKDLIVKKKRDGWPREQVAFN